MIHKFLFCHIIVFLCILSANSQIDIAEGFFDQKVSENFTLPVGIEFDDNGNGYVWEKSGKVYSLDPVTSEKTLILDISEEVGSWGDHGLTGFALDPDFMKNGYIYTAYNVDRYYLFNFGESDYDADSTIIKNATIGRVSRFTFDVNVVPILLQEQSKKILVGTDLHDGFPILADFHGVGSLAFGNDGTLFIGCGDSGLDSEPGTDYHTNQALKDGIIDSTMILGSYRAQSLYSLNGKLLRINKDTGDGLKSNPYFDENNPRSSHSRIWALGFRNPYKFVHIPGTGGHNPELGLPGKFVLGDVGSSYWEEFNLVDGKGLNFGWPVYEGHHGAWPYGYYQVENPYAPNPAYDTDNCERPNFIFSDLIVQENADRSHEFINPCGDEGEAIPLSYPTYIHSRPILYYNNVQWNQPKRSFVPGFDEDGVANEISTDSMGISDPMEGYSAIPGSWYDKGSLPDSFNHSLIVSDFSGWIKAIEFDETYKLKKIRNIRSNIKGVVDVKHNLLDDCLYYVHILTGEIRKICFGGNPPPVAIVKADKVYGGNSFTVNFDASESYDPNLLPITVEWDFKDGEKSNDFLVNHKFETTSSNPEKVTVTLTVTDSLGAKAKDSIDISLNNSPPLVEITSPTAQNTFAVNGYNRIDLDAQVLDVEESNESLQYTWQIHLHHNLHFHSEEPVNLKKFSSLIEPVGCAEKDLFWYRVSLEVEDSHGLKESDEVTIYPNCDEYGEINWKRFTGDGNSLQLNWENINPTNPDRIIVQKVDYAGNILDVGTSTEMKFIDKNPEIGENRYRLKIYTSANKYFYSSENEITFPLAIPVTIYPNPVSASPANVQITQHLNEDVIITLYSLSGIKLVEKVYKELTGKNVVASIDVQDLPAGLYIVSIQNGSRIFQERLKVLK